MKKYKILLFFSFLLFVSSCNNKKLTEVVEVPLPAADEKLTIGNPDDVKADEGTFELKKLPYAYDALIPHIDAATMEIHYSKHYLGYTNNLNKEVTSNEMVDMTIEEILAKIDGKNTILRNNAGGYYNHNLFWENMGTKTTQPKDTLASSIERDFGSFANFETVFKDAANKQFGSGWAWLLTDKMGKLQVSTTPNHDNPLMPISEVKGIPILALDVWEHAYYLNYQNKRAKYIDAFFTIINWKVVEKRYEEAINN